MSLYIETELKPLYANLKRLAIGEYLNTKEFKLFMLEGGLDDLWTTCEKEVRRNQRVVVLGYHDIGDDEEALMYFMSAWYDQEPETLGNFILPLLANFAEWNPIKLNYEAVIRCLKKLKVPSGDLAKYQKNTVLFTILNQQN